MIAKRIALSYDLSNLVLSYEGFSLRGADIALIKKKLRMRKLVWTYGISAGLVMAVLLAISIPFMKSSLSSGTSAGELLGYLSMILALSVIFFAIKTHRDRQQGLITFGNAFKVGLYITLITSAIYTFSWMLLSGWLYPDFMVDYMTGVLTDMESEGATSTEIAAKRAEMEKFVTMFENPLIKIGVTFLEIFPVGLVVSLIAALILKNNKRIAA